MRKSLQDLIEKTIIFKYELPNAAMKIPRIILSNYNDQCFSINGGKTEIVEIIYNSIVEYSFNEFDMSNKDYDALHAKALQSKFKYDPSDNDNSKLKYGFYGEVILYSILVVLYKANPIISRGYFYSPLENSETKGYDAYHLIENNGITELWFGETKFHSSHSNGINSALKNVGKAISDDYLKRNILEFSNHKENFNIKGSKISAILNEWDKNPSIVILNEIKKHNMKLVYPILLLYQDDGKGYDHNIRKVEEYIKNNYKAITFGLSIDYSIFFILLPIEKVKEIKTEVIKWIESRKPLML